LKARTRRMRPDEQKCSLRHRGGCPVRGQHTLAIEYTVTELERVKRCRMQQGFMYNDSVQVIWSWL
jgi:ribosomal protein S13